MALFARRALQKMLDNLATRLPSEARQKLARELNRPGTSTLGFEWELALLFGLSRVGDVEYEPPSLAGRRPDITFVGDTETPLRFTADIATVSDEGLEKDNPATRLSLALIQLKRKYKLPGSTTYEIKGEATGPHFRDRKMRLKLPPGPDIEKLLEKHVGPVFKRVRDEKLSTASVAIHEPGVELTIGYEANRRYGSGRHPSYTAAYSLKRNPVYTKLHSKLAQLKKSKAPGPFGIFLCDGGCALLKNTQRHGDTVSIDQVVQEFFRENASISFVVVLFFPPAQSAPFVGIVKDLRITRRVYINRRAKQPIDKVALLDVINSSLEHWPAAANTAHDALWWLEHGEKGRGEAIHVISHGGNLMSQTFKVSARKIQEILAGMVTPAQFCDNYASPGAPFQNPFLRALKLGHTIQSVTLTHAPGADDDILEFKFAPDAAIGKIAAKEPASTG